MAAVAAAEQTQTQPQPAAKKPRLPIRLWTAGPGSPQEKIVIPGQRYGLRPRPDGSYLIQTEEELAAAERALGARFWPDDLPADVESLRCSVCGWTCRSYRAMNHHQNYVHGRV